MRWSPFFLGFLALAAACVIEDKPLNPDGSISDGSVEAGECGFCPMDRPVCFETRCVQCTAEEDDYCTDRVQFCDTEAFECVNCLADGDCRAASASRCDLDSNECESCESNEQCDDVNGLPSTGNACDEGTCVDCTPGTESDTCANDMSCNPATRECTNTQVGSLDVCEECVADSECGDEGEPSEAYRCVPMFYAGERFPDEETGFCLKSIALGGSCSNPYRIVLTRPSLSGGAPDDYCSINEELATCPAVRALLSDTECDPANGDEDCPPAGICRELPGDLNRCTYLCSDLVECKNPPAPGSTCGASSSGNGDYCGG